jgi:hypothetical protein
MSRLVSVPDVRPTALAVGHDIRIGPIRPVVSIWDLGHGSSNRGQNLCCFGQGDKIKALAFIAFYYIVELFIEQIFDNIIQDNVLSHFGVIS